MTGWRDLLPVPLAAPETPMLRGARVRVIMGCAVLSATVLFFGELRTLSRPLAFPWLGATVTFVIVQGWLWLKAKNAADDAWLMQGREDQDAT